MTIFDVLTMIGGLCLFGMSMGANIAVSIIDAYAYNMNAHQRLQRIHPFGLFRQYFAVCCAHNSFADGERIPHLQPEKCFRPRTRRGRKQLNFIRRLRGELCEAFLTV